jgi:transmembrane sensor
MTSEPRDDPETEKVASEATAWFVRLKDPSATNADRWAFRRWLASDPKRHEAFNEVKRLWSDLETPAAILGKGGWYRDTAKPARTLVMSRSLPYAASLAGCLVVACAALLWRDAGLIDRMRADYATRPGERQEITLAEGSSAYLDGDTALTVKLDSNGRRTRLLRGRAWFDVMPNKNSPFTVATSDVEARVIGTAFAMEWDHGAIGVVVERGVVTVSHANDKSVEVPAGQQVRVAGGRMGQVTKVDAAAALAWRHGLIILDQAPLGRVVDELERMQPGRVIITDSSLRRLTLSGVFRSDDPDAVVEALNSALGLKTVSILGFAILVYR